MLVYTIVVQVGDKLELVTAQQVASHYGPYFAHEVNRMLNSVLDHRVAAAEGAYNAADDAFKSYYAAIEAKRERGDAKPAEKLIAEECADALNDADPFDRDLQQSLTFARSW